MGNCTHCEINGVIMKPEDTIMWLDDIESGMIKSQNGFINDIYKKGSWWRNAYDKALNELSIEGIEKLNARIEYNHHRFELDV